MNLEDAIALTNATAGKSLAVQTVRGFTLNASQRTQLASLVQSTGAWPGQSAHIVSVTFYRDPGQPAQIKGIISGVRVYNDGNAASSDRANIEDIIGTVP